MWLMIYCKKWMLYESCLISKITVNEHLIVDLNNSLIN